MIESPKTASPLRSTRPALWLFGTLLLGIVIGSLLTGLVVRQRFASLEMMRKEGGFESIVIEAIDPSDAQLLAIEPILADARTGMFENVLFLRGRMIEHMDTTLTRLDVHLDDAQMDEARRILRVEPSQHFLRQMPEELRRRIEKEEAR